MPYTRNEEVENKCFTDEECGKDKICRKDECVWTTPSEKDPNKNIGRVIIARGDIPWDVKPPAWDDLVPPCCNDPDPCEGKTCGEGEICVDGDCLADQCYGITCPEGFLCVGGSCEEQNPCKDIVCEEGFECRNGACYELSDPCCIENEDCKDGFKCEDGRCVEITCESPDDCGENQDCVDNKCVDKEEPEPEPECEIDEDCGDNDLVCIENKCVGGEPPEPECSSPDDCGENQTCEDGKCVDITPEPEPTPECTSPDDCGENQTCIDEKCIDIPTAECTSPDDCGENQDCVDYKCVDKEPERECVIDKDCGEEGMFDCIDGKCVAIEDRPDCITSFDCGDNEYCIGGKCLTGSPGYQYYEVRSPNPITAVNKTPINANRPDRRLWWTLRSEGVWRDWYVPGIWPVGEDPDNPNDLWVFPCDEAGKRLGPSRRWTGSWNALNNLEGKYDFMTIEEICDGSKSNFEPGMYIMGQVMRPLNPNEPTDPDAGCDGIPPLPDPEWPGCDGNEECDEDKICVDFKCKYTVSPQECSAEYPFRLAFLNPFDRPEGTTATLNCQGYIGLTVFYPIDETVEYSWYVNDPRMEDQPAGTGKYFEFTWPAAGEEATITAMAWYKHYDDTLCKNWSFVSWTVKGQPADGSK